MLVSQEEIEKWATTNYKNLEPAIPLQALSLAEEAGEVCRAALKMHQGIRGTREQWMQEIMNEVGDVYVNLAMIANRCDFDLITAINQRWEVLKDRNWNANHRGHGLPERDIV